MKVFLIRHAEALSPDEYDGSDLSRPLTQKGKLQARKVFEGMRKIQSSFDYIITSGALRAYETAAIMHQFYKKAHFEKNTVLNPGAEYPEFWRILAPHSGTGKKIAIIGHEPDLSECATGLILSSLATCNEDHTFTFPFRLKKTGCIVLEEKKDSSFELIGVYSGKFLRNLVR